MYVALIALVVSATSAEEAAKEAKKQEKRGLLGLGYGYAYDGGYDIGAGGHGGLEYAHTAYAVPIAHAAPIATHHEKVVTVVKNVPVPYPVEKQVPYPVEKHVPYPVKVK